MANMSHCRFTNTASDLKDCYDHMDDDDMSEEEQRARRKLIRICDLIATDYGEEGK